MLDSMVVKEAMTSHVITTTQTTPIAQEACIMIEHKIGYLPVLSNGKLQGILTEEDFVHRIKRKQ